MIGAITNSSERNRDSIVVGVLLLASGPLMNYLFERHDIFKVWENSAYPISASDVFYPPLCVLVSLTGIVLTVGGAIRRTAIRGLRGYVLAIVIPLTLAYTLFSFAMQFIATSGGSLRRVPRPRPSCF